MTVIAAGFNREQVHTLVEVSRDTDLTIQLKVATSGATVTVSEAQTPVVDLTSTSLNEVVDGKTTRELPLNGRDWTMLAVLEPNVHTVDNQISISAGDNSRANRGVGTRSRSEERGRSRMSIASTASSPMITPAPDQEARWAEPWA